MSHKGLLIVHTGNGKGKTTAALGLAFRALGHQLPVCIVQFIKGDWKYGELTSAERFKGLLDFCVAGEGFSWKSKEPGKDQQAAKEGWELVKRAIGAGRYHLVILDELTYPVNFGWIEETEVLETLRNRPENLHVLVTGRNAQKSLIEMADLVTEMRAVKHPFKSGVKAQKGIEW